MEIAHDAVRRDGFFFDKQSLRLDLYRLMSAFYATGQFARLASSSDHDPVVELADELQETEITRLLLAVAGTVRVVQDRKGGAGALFEAPCGVHYPDISSRSHEALRKH